MIGKKERQGRGEVAVPADQIAASLSPMMTIATSELDQLEWRLGYTDNALRTLSPRMGHSRCLEPPPSLPLRPI
jgi:hypothetical protein